MLKYAVVAAISFATLLPLGLAVAAPPVESPAVARGADGRLIYATDALGNRIPDFSHCGYGGGGRALPAAPVRIALEPKKGDDGARIQAAIDRVSQAPPDGQGIRGAVYLSAGRFEVSGHLRISASGVVLRGAGAGTGGTELVATGQDRRALIQIGGEAKRVFEKPALAVTDEYAPVGATRLRVDDPDRLKPGDHVTVSRPSTARWIAAVGADAFGVGWRPGSRDICWDREVVAVEGETVVIDAPVTTAISKEFGGGIVHPVRSSQSVKNVGVEDLRLVSQYDETKEGDEEHAWFGVVAEAGRDIWIRRIECRHFAGGAVMLLHGVRRATVEDCISTAPVSEIGGYRRHTFFTQGQQTLFLRCWSEHGRHDFAVGHAAAGPNAFVNCYAHEARGDSGPLESWASGVLYDNVRIDGNELRLENRWSTPPGTGWSAANCVLWQCQASVVRCFRPPTAANWAIGTWAVYAGDGKFEARSDFVEPLSLYQAQLRDRLGDEAADLAGPLLLDPVGATNPTPEEAAAFTAYSQRAGGQLVDLIRQRFAAHAAKGGDLPPNRELDPAAPPSAEPRARRLELTNGWLQIGGRVSTGKWLRPAWWRGTIRPAEAPAFGPSITRFAPGRVGLGLTDDLAAVARRMRAGGAIAYEHHYGLWYDRRRDDHLMVRRGDGNVAPPFFEQPFARTGRGAAWDGLSRYDLTRWNPWYWRRLRDFAELCDEQGLVFVHQHYFQHNILEAGAHWADSPWRPANNVNDTGFPEPPPYVGDKRIFLAEQFYDVRRPQRRQLHRGYIQQCLDNFADGENVIQMTSAEYSGPLEFVQFWIDVIAEWQEETGRDVIVALSAPKNVQDAILADEQRSRHVDVIDIRYWCYTANGETYAPDGGQQLAPRQHLRQTRQKPGGAAEILRAVREYRGRFPEKAVIYRAEEHCPSRADGWAKLIGGGSLAETPGLPDELLAAIVAMRPADDIGSGGDVYCLGGEGQYLCYAENRDGIIELTLPDSNASYRGEWIDRETGVVSEGPLLNGGRKLQVEFKQHVLWLRR